MHMVFQRIQVVEIWKGVGYDGENPRNLPNLWQHFGALEDGIAGFEIYHYESLSCCS